MTQNIGNIMNGLKCWRMWSMMGSGKREVRKVSWSRLRSS